MISVIKLGGNGEDSRAGRSHRSPGEMRKCLRVGGKNGIQMHGKSTFEMSRSTRDMPRMGFGSFFGLVVYASASGLEVSSWPRVPKHSLERALFVISML